VDRDDPAYKGQAGYNPFLLAIYDPFVLGFKAAPSVGTPVTLLDPNPNVLARSSRRLAAMHPTTIEADVRIVRFIHRPRW
jgi:hypothetical protein